jgi:hypothetical protein
VTWRRPPRPAPVGPGRRFRLRRCADAVRCTRGVSPPIRCMDGPTTSWGRRTRRVHTSSGCARACRPAGGVGASRLVVCQCRFTRWVTARSGSWPGRRVRCGVRW